MRSTEIELRRNKGQQIALAKKIRKCQGAWVVPSATGGGAYVVNNSSCTCPDYETRLEKCKHVFAVEFYVERRKNRDGSVTIETETIIKERKTYSQDWARYNEAQTKEKDYFTVLLKHLCSNIEMPVQKGRGRPRIPISDAVFSCVMKVYTTVSGRRATCDLKACKEKGMVDRQPHYNSIFNYLEKPEMKGILESLILTTALPLKGVESSFSMDASGFSTTTYERWFDEKYGKEKSKNKWLKAHVTIGNKTNVVTAVRITDAYSHDTNHFVPLLNDTAENFNVEEVMADKGYLSHKNYLAVEEKGAKPYIMFKSSNKSGEGPDIWRKMFGMYQYMNDEFRRHYHQRSNVETTFSMIKRKFGPSLRSKGEVSQVNELLCKILCHNICCLISSIFELGVEVEFWGQRQAA